MIVADSSSLILLAKINHLDTALASFKKKIVIPQKVYEESTMKTNTFDADLIKQRVKQECIALTPIKNFKMNFKIQKDFNLGRGEAEAITLCIEHNTSLVTDDKKVINACKILQLTFTTVPNIILALYKTGKITQIDAQLAINKLEIYGRYSQAILLHLKEELNNEKNE
ncbi:MAG: hypothetical protein AABW64_04555 [Nanoarchaeota archaeon]